MEHKKLLKSLMIITGIIIIIIIIVILSLMGEGKMEEKELGQATKNQIDPIINPNNEYKEEDSPTRFYTIELVLKKYIEYLHLDYEKKETVEDTIVNAYEISSEEEKKEKIIDVLDIDFIKENNITINNIDQYIVMDTDEVKSLRALKMNVLEKEQFKTYGVQIQYTTQSGKNNIEYFIVTLDEFNSTYMIKPLKDINDISEIKLTDKKSYDKIENRNKNNKYSYYRINDEEMSAKYFRTYRDLMINNTEEAYNKLSKEYREKRFKNYDNFKQYVEKNKQEITRADINQYLVEKNGDNKEYVCKDGNENMYIFTTLSVANYTVKLDTHTIDSNEFKETYDSANEQNKIAMNVSKWASMINTRDYQAAYNVLDETFRNSNFGSVENFENYMREMYPKYYNINIKDVKKESNAYVADVEIQEKDYSTVTGAGTYQNNIIMQLKDNREFVMSFYVRRH